MTPQITLTLSIPDAQALFRLLSTARDSYPDVLDDLGRELVDLGALPSDADWQDPLFARLHRSSPSRA